MVMENELKFLIRLIVYMHAKFLFFLSMKIELIIYNDMIPKQTLHSGHEHIA